MPLPFSKEITYGDLMGKIGAASNVSFYTDGYREEGRCHLGCNWNIKVAADFISQFQTAKPFPGVVAKTAGTSQTDDEKINGKTTLSDCLEESEKPELLDEDNKWYCPNCKDHVQATKTLQIYKAPLVLVINLKRFKQGKESLSKLWKWRWRETSDRGTFPH